MTPVTNSTCYQACEPTFTVTDKQNSLYVTTYPAGYLLFYQGVWNVFSCCSNSIAALCSKKEPLLEMERIEPRRREHAEGYLSVLTPFCCNPHHGLSKTQLVFQFAIGASQLALGSLLLANAPSISNASFLTNHQADCINLCQKL